MADIVLKAEARTKIGGSTAKELRRNGRVPGVLYGHGEASIPFHVKALDLRPLIYTQETHIVNLNLDGKLTRSILREVQFDPISDHVRHIDLIILHAGEKVKLDVPVSLTGTAAGVKDGGIIDFVMHKLTINVLPDQIPQHIEVDISSLKIGHGIHVKDLPANEGYSILADENAVIVACVAPKVVEEPVPGAVAEIVEPEQIQAKGKKEEEGEAETKK
ncbi:MAG: 50S ribosomal protein L25 [Candidatus Kapaibacterium sp.]